jgi:glycosyltransferase involved in cell wall biosynthesis
MTTTPGVVAAPAPAPSVPPPINVLFLTIDIRIGGAERLVLELVRKLDRSRFSPSVGWFVDEPPPREFVELGIPLFPLRKERRFDWAAMKRLAVVVRERRIDVINAHHFMSFFYAMYAARLAGRVGLVYTEHSEADVSRARGVWRPVGTLLMRYCDAVVGISGAVSTALRRHFRVPFERVHTIENGVDVEVFANAVDSRVDVRRELGIDAETIVIGCVANFRRNKNHLFLAKAFLRAFDRSPGVRLLLIGQGFPGDPENSMPSVQSFVRENGLEPTVSLLGYRPDVHRVVGAMDVVCLVSYKEGLPLSVIEAMASGLPVVVTEAEGLRDVVEQEVSGLRVVPDDVEGLAAALRRLAGDVGLRRSLGESARRVARERYSFSRCLDETQQLFSGVSRRHG